MKNTIRLFSIIIILALLAGCAPAPTPAPTATATNTPAPTATALPIEPEPLIPPYLRPGSEYLPIAVQPPLMNKEITLGTEVDDVTDVSAASAVFALARKGSPELFADFTASMNTYLHENSNVKLIQVEGNGIIHSMLLNEHGHVLLVFDDAENAANGIGYGVGALTFSDTGYWKDKATGVWINPGLKNGESLSLVPGEDGHGYVVKLDADGNVIAYLNTHGATRENIKDQWIKVVDGMPEKVWDGSKMVFRAPEIGQDIQELLNGLSYKIGTVYGLIPAIIVEEGGEDYAVMVAEDGEWVGYYKDMSKCVREDGTFDMKTAAKVFWIRVEDGKFKDKDYANYQKSMWEIYEGLKKSQLGEAIAIGGGGTRSELTEGNEFALSITGGSPPRIIGFACQDDEQDDICIATVAMANGIFTMSFFRGVGVGYTQHENQESVEQVIANIASGKTASQILISSTLISEGKINPRANFTISSEEMLKVYFELTRGFGMSLDDLALAVKQGPPSWDTKTVLRVLSEWDQPVPVYNAIGCWK